MGRAHQGIATFNANFEIGMAAPLDNRDVVEYYADLENSIGLNKYIGELVYVLNDTSQNGSITYPKGYYMYDGTQWKPFNESSVDIEVGGRNLLPDTRVKHFNLYGSPTVTFIDNVIVTEWNASDGIRAVGTKGTNYIYGTYQSPYPQQIAHWKAKQYVVSMYVKNLGQTRVCIQSNGNSNKRCIWGVGEEGRKYFVIDGSGITGSNIGFNFVDPDNVSGYTFDFVYWHPKVEEGNIPTDWLPATEDTLCNELIGNEGGRLVIALCELTAGTTTNTIKGWSGNIIASRNSTGDDFAHWAKVDIMSKKNIDNGFEYTLITTHRNTSSSLSNTQGFRACRFQYTINNDTKWFGGLEFYNGWGNRNFYTQGVSIPNSFTPFIVKYATVSGSTATAVNSEIYNSIDFSTTSCVEKNVTYNGVFLGNSSTATKLTTARSLKTKLDSTTTVSFDGSADQNAIPVVGTLPIANGGTGQTTAQDACNDFINALSTGASTPTDSDYYVSQYVGGGTTTTTYHRRPISALWSYIKSKMSNDSAVNISGNAATATTATKLGTSSFGNKIKPFYLNAGVPTACDIYRYHYDSTSDYASYAWHKIAYAVAAAQLDRVVTFFVTTGNGVARNGILKCRVRWDAESAFNSSNTKLNWVVNNGIDINDFVFVWKSPNVELWCKIPERYGGYQFTVLDSGNRTSNGLLVWTLCDSVSGHGESSYTSGGTVITSINATLTNNINGAVNGYSIAKSVPSDAVFTDTTYESKSASSGGTAVSLVTTGEKYSWNNKAAGSHTHGNIQNGGTLQTSDITIASGDKLVVTDSSDSSKIARASISFDGSTATKCLTQKGTWESFTNNSGTITKVGNTSSGAVTVSSSNDTATWGSAVTVGSVGGVDLKFTMPSIPASNKTTLGGVKVWVESGSTDILRISTT